MNILKGCDCPLRPSLRLPPYNEGIVRRAKGYRSIRHSSMFFYFIQKIRELIIALSKGNIPAPPIGSLQHSLPCEALLLPWAVGIWRGLAHIHSGEHTNGFPHEKYFISNIFSKLPDFSSVQGVDRPNLGRSPAVGLDGGAVQSGGKSDGPEFAAAAADGKCN